MKDPTIYSYVIADVEYLGVDVIDPNFPGARREVCYFGDGASRAGFVSTGSSEGLGEQEMIDFLVGDL